MMFSATLSKESRIICKKFVQNSKEIYIDEEEKMTLEGLNQYYVDISESAKNRKLIDILDATQFNQCMVFVRTVQRARALNNLLVGQNFPSICVFGSMPQKIRLERYNAFREGKKHIMVSTDLMGRGVDYGRVNLVFHYDMSKDKIDYHHRSGRAGRFGTKGIIVSFLSTDDDR